MKARPHPRSPKPDDSVRTSEHAKEQQEIDDEIEHLQFSFAGAGSKRGQRAQHASKDGSRSADANQMCSRVA